MRRARGRGSWAASRSWVAEVREPAGVDRSGVQQVLREEAGGVLGDGIMAPALIDRMLYDCDIFQVPWQQLWDEGSPSPPSPRRRKAPPGSRLVIRRRPTASSRVRFRRPPAQFPAADTGVPRRYSGHLLRVALPLRHKCAASVAI